MVDQVFHKSGFGFVTGSVIGGAGALMDCIRYGDPGDTVRLKMVRILNMVSHRGRRMGAAGGALGALYACVEETAIHVQGRKSVGCVFLAGAAAGFAYSSSSGRLRGWGSALGGLAGGLGAFASSSYQQNKGIMDSEEEET